MPAPAASAIAAISRQISRSDYWLGAASRYDTGASLTSPELCGSYAQRSAKAAPTRAYLLPALLPPFKGIGQRLEFALPQPELFLDLRLYCDCQHQSASPSFFSVISAVHGRSPP
jgi:hypothetical protein